MTRNLGEIATAINRIASTCNVPRGWHARKTTELLDRHGLTASGFDAEVQERTSPKTAYYYVASARDLVES